MKDVRRELESREELLKLQLRANVQRMVDTTLAPGGDALGVVRRHPILTLGGAALAGIVAGRLLPAGKVARGGGKALRGTAAVLGAALRAAAPMLLTALKESRR